MKTDSIPGSKRLENEIYELYCLCVINEPFRNEFDIYVEFFSDELENEQYPRVKFGHFKKKKIIKQRLAFLYQDEQNLITETGLREIVNLQRSIDTLYKQSHDNTGYIVDDKTYVLYLKALDMLNKMNGKYSMKIEHDVTIDEGSIADSIDTLIMNKLENLEKGE